MNNEQPTVEKSFLDSVRAGIAKAEEANSISIEINNLFDRVNEDLAEFSGVKITLTRQKRSSAELMLATARACSLGHGMSAEQDLIMSVTYNGFVHAYSVGTWQQRTEFYPCIITAPKLMIMCNNLIELTEGIRTLLSSSHFGSILKCLIQACENGSENLGAVATYTTSR